MKWNKNILNRRSLVTAYGATALIAISSKVQAQGTEPGKIVNNFQTAEDKGAVGDGITNDTAAIAAMIAGTSSWVMTSSRKYRIEASNLTTDKKLFGVSLLGRQGNSETLRSSGPAQKVKLIGIDIDATSGTALSNNSPNCKDFFISSSIISTDGAYGILSNKGSSGTDGLIVSASSIYSSVGDALEWNHPASDSYNFTAVANLLSGGPNGSGTTSGFAVGVAGTDGHLTIGNHVRVSRNEAFHFEGAQKRGILGMNTVQNAKGDGVRILYRKGGEPILIQSNQLNHTGAKTGFSGIRIANDPNGSLIGNSISGNNVKGFEFGYKTDGGGIQVAESNTASFCDFAIRLAPNTKWLGKIYSFNCAQIAYGGSRAIFGKLVSNTSNLTPLVKLGDGNPGTYCKGILMPFSVTHPGGGVQSFNCITLPDLMSGRITIIAGGGIHGIFITANVKWDGVKLNISDILTKTTGQINAVALIASNTYFAIEIGSKTPLKLDATFDFDGVFYVH